ncbi:MAG: superoxide dismutase, Ni [Candidatus Spechtbacteria bacterium]|nr:superoxide dismutase, Ni [Candidatus Spechtbacteria bacterium]
MHLFFKKILQSIDVIYPAPVIRAHCDIPCGIYTTHQAGIAAETIEKMVQKLTDLGHHSVDASVEEKLIWENANGRMTQIKEEWAQICKQELLILWTDYFKEEHLEMFPDLHEKFWKVAKLCSQNKREVNIKAARELRAAVDEIAEMFKKAEGDKAVTKRQEWL